MKRENRVAHKASKRARFSQVPEDAARKADVSAASALPKSRELSKSLIICAGSYERLLFGLECHTNSSGLVTLQPMFSFPAHIGSIRSLTIIEGNSGKQVLATGGADESIKLWDLRKKREIGTVEGGHSGTVTVLRNVPKKGLLAVVASDGIALYQSREWIHLRTLKGHQGRTNSIDPHPDGRVLLSVGQDKMLRMWDLAAGKAVTALKQEEEGEIVKWAPDGRCFIVLTRQTATLFGLNMDVLGTAVIGSRLHDVCFIAQDRNTQRWNVALACEDGKTYIYSFDGASGTQSVGKQVGVLSGHSNRVKSVDCRSIGDEHFITTISSDGLIHVYHYQHRANGQEEPIQPVASYETGQSRLTCLACAMMPSRWYALIPATFVYQYSLGFLLQIAE